MPLQESRLSFLPLSAINGEGFSHGATPGPDRRGGSGHGLGTTWGRFRPVCLTKRIPCEF